MTLLKQVLIELSKRGTGMVVQIMEKRVGKRWLSVRLLQTNRGHTVFLPRIPHHDRNELPFT